MVLEIIARNALNKLKENYNLPKSGFIAGGAIANSIWGLVSGNSPVINDIDIFILNDKLDKFDENDKSSLFRYKEDDIKYSESYTGITHHSKTKDFYTIVSSERDGIFNYIKYNSNNDRPDFILNSFDINCTKVGYSIDEDKFYFTKDFEYFIKTGKLLVTNVTTPSHTSIRIVKKSKELNVKLEDFELKILSQVLFRKFTDTNKICFKDKYKKDYEKNSDVLNKYFNLSRDKDLEAYIFNQFKVKDELYKLSPTDIFKNSTKLFGYYNLFNDINIDSINNSTDFIFYIRKIYDNSELSKIWSKLSYFFIDDYIDCEISDKDIDLLYKLIKYAPNSINTLKGLKISQQLSLINRLLKEFKDDPIIAISLLEKGNVDIYTNFDEKTKLLLELSVRKEIVMNNNKVRSILNSTLNEKFSKIKLIL